MARAEKGFFGGVYGKLGNVVFYRRNGKVFARSKPKNKKRAPSRAQMRQRIRFQKVSRFAHTLRPIVACTFRKNHRGRIGTNIVISKVFEDALVGEYPDLEIDYSKVVISNGTLGRGRAEDAIRVAGHIEFRWWEVEEHPNAHVVLVAYFPKVNQSIYTIGTAVRAAGTARLEIPPSLQSGDAETWIGFVTPNLADASMSEYTGRVKAVVTRSRKRGARKPR